MAETEERPEFKTLKPKTLSDREYKIVHGVYAGGWEGIKSSIGAILSPHLWFRLIEFDVRGASQWKEAIDEVCSKLEELRMPDVPTTSDLEGEGTRAIPDPEAFATWLTQNVPSIAQDPRVPRLILRLFAVGAITEDNLRIMGIENRGMLITQLSYIAAGLLEQEQATLLIQDANNKLEEAQKKSGHQKRYVALFATLTTVGVAPVAAAASLTGVPFGIATGIGYLTPAGLQVVSAGLRGLGGLARRAGGKAEKRRARAPFHETEGLPEDFVPKDLLPVIVQEYGREDHPQPIGMSIGEGSELAEYIEEDALSARSIELEGREANSIADILDRRFGVEIPIDQEEPFQRFVIACTHLKVRLHNQLGSLTVLRGEGEGLPMDIQQDLYEGCTGVQEELATLLREVQAETPVNAAHFIIYYLNLEAAFTTERRGGRRERPAEEARPIHTQGDLMDRLNRFTSETRTETTMSAEGLGNPIATYLPLVVPAGRRAEFREMAERASLEWTQERYRDERREARELDQILEPAFDDLHPQERAALVEHLDIVADGRATQFDADGDQADFHTALNRIGQDLFYLKLCVAAAQAGRNANGVVQAYERFTTLRATRNEINHDMQLIIDRLGLGLTPEQLQGTCFGREAYEILEELARR